MIVSADLWQPFLVKEHHWACETSLAATVVPEETQAGGIPHYVLVESVLTYDISACFSSCGLKFPAEGSKPSRRDHQGLPFPLSRIYSWAAAGTGPRQLSETPRTFWTASLSSQKCLVQAAEQLPATSSPTTQYSRLLNLAAGLV